MNATTRKYSRTETTPDLAITMNGDDCKPFQKRLKLVAKWSDSEATRYALGDILIESSGGTWRMVATDERRLAAVKCNAVNSNEGIVRIPPKLVSILCKLPARDFAGGITVTERDGWISVMLHSPQVEVSSISSAGRFPMWWDVIPGCRGVSYAVTTKANTIAVLDNLPVTTGDDYDTVSLVSDTLTDAGTWSGMLKIQHRFSRDILDLIRVSDTDLVTFSRADDSDMLYVQTDNDEVSICVMSVRD